MPATKHRKRNKRSESANTKTPKAPKKQPDHVLSDVYDTEPNRSYINVRYWSHIMGYLAAFLLYFFVSFHPTIMVKGPAQYLIGPLFKRTSSNNDDCVSLDTYGRICLLLWSFHFVRRTCETMFMQSFYRYAPHSEISSSIIFYASLAVFNGVCNNIYVWSREQWSCPMLSNVVLGICLFCIGQIGNCYHHYLLRQIRREYWRNICAGFEGHILPTGGMFDYVSCPHYLFEAVTWIGWMFVCQGSAGSFLIFGISLANLLMKATQTHVEYKKKFKALYPTSRTALIPFVF